MNHRIQILCLFGNLSTELSTYNNLLSSMQHIGTVIWLIRYIIIFCDYPHKMFYECYKL